MHQIIPIEVGMGTEKNYILLVGKKCVLELVTYLTTYLLLPSQKKMVEQASCFTSFKNISVV